MKGPGVLVGVSVGVGLGVAVLVGVGVSVAVGVIVGGTGVKFNTATWVPADGLPAPPNAYIWPAGALTAAMQHVGAGRDVVLDQLFVAML
jgi:hypothetical protein